MGKFLDAKILEAATELVWSLASLLCRFQNQDWGLTGVIAARAFPAGLMATSGALEPLSSTRLLWPRATPLPQDPSANSGEGAHHGEPRGDREVAGFPKGIRAANLDGHDRRGGRQELQGGLRLPMGAPALSPR